MLENEQAFRLKLFHDREQVRPRLSILSGMIIVPAKAVEFGSSGWMKLERLLNHQTSLIEIRVSVDVHVPQIIVSLRRFGRVKFNALLKEPGRFINHVR